MTFYNMTDLPVNNTFVTRNWITNKLRCRKYRECKRDNIVGAVASIIEDESGVNPFELNEYRGRGFVLSRQLFFRMLCKYTKKSLEEIGAFLGKDHATVIHSRTTVNNLCETDREFRAMYERIDQRVKKLIR